MYWYLLLSSCVVSNVGRVCPIGKLDSTTYITWRKRAILFGCVRSWSWWTHYDTMSKCVQYHDYDPSMKTQHTIQGTLIAYRYNLSCHTDYHTIPYHTIQPEIIPIPILLRSQYHTGILKYFEVSKYIQRDIPIVPILPRSFHRYYERHPRRSNLISRNRKR